MTFYQEGLLMSGEDRRGIWLAFGAYTVWGLLPVYWKALHAVPAGTILANRIVWSVVFVAVLLTLRRNWGWLPAALRSRRTVLTYVGAGVLLSINWYIYIWAVNAGFLVDSSLGYFITPLVNVLLGVLVFHERLRPPQWAAVGLAAAGVLYITATYGQLPWIGLSLALTFGMYGLVKKQARLPSLQGMALETAAIVLPALGFLVYQEATGAGVLGHVDWWTTLLLAGTGVITVIPLLWFADAAQRIPLSTMGVIQYVSPTLMFLLGLLVFQETFNVHKLIGFLLIWSALAVYWLTSSRAPKAPATPRVAAPLR
jgi:chloramphenicol-sensitive protein RarD